MNVGEAEGADVVHDRNEVESLTCSNEEDGRGCPQRNRKFLDSVGAFLRGGDPRGENHAGLGVGIPMTKKYAEKKLFDEAWSRWSRATISHTDQAQRVFHT